jgi:hypothetical protein
LMNAGNAQNMTARHDPPAAAIHLDIDERFYMVYQPKASSLWRKNSRKRLPNGVQLRLVPCFTSPIGKSLTDEIRADAKLLAERQYFFVKEHIRSIDYHFISLLDTPVSDDNPMTLRRAMMSRAPKDKPTSRLIHNVDQAWNQTTKHVVTTVVGRDIEANRFLANMIPEFLHVHGPDAAKWFTSQGINVYKDVRWNPKKGTTSSSNAKASAAMVEEDLWDLSDKWKTLSEKVSATSRPNEKSLDLTGKTTTQAPTLTKPPKIHKEDNTAKEKLLERLAGDKSVASFKDSFGRDLDSDDERDDANKAAEEAEAAKNQADLIGTKFLFSTAQLERDKERALEGYESDGRSMSTAGKTTESTRLKLKETQEELQELKLKNSERDKKDKVKKAKRSSSKKHPRPLPEIEGMDTMSTNEVQVISTVMQIVQAATTEDIPAKEPGEVMTDAQIIGAALSRKPNQAIEPDSDDMEEEEHEVMQIVQVATTEDIPTNEEPEETMTDAQIIGAALSRKPKEAIEPDSDAMEEEEHEVVHIGSSSEDLSESSTSSSSSSSSASSSSSSDGSSQDTQELINKLSSNPYLPLSNLKHKPKDLTKTDRSSGSKSDSASHQSSGQDSGSTSDHLPVDSSGNTGDASDVAGVGD